MLGGVSAQVIGSDCLKHDAERTTVTMQRGRVMETSNPFPSYITITHMRSGCCDVALHHTNTHMSKTPHHPLTKLCEAF